MTTNRIAERPGRSETDACELTERKRRYVRVEENLNFIDEHRGRNELTDSAGQRVETSGSCRNWRGRTAASFSIPRDASNRVCSRSEFMPAATALRVLRRQKHKVRPFEAAGVTRKPSVIRKR